MSERFARLYGPTTLSTDPNSQTTLFTVPANKLYVIRDVTMVGSAEVTGSAGGSATTHLTKDGQSLLSVGGADLTERFTGSVAVYGGETVQGYIAAGGGGGITIENTASVTEDGSLGSVAGDFTGGLSDVPTNLYFFASTKKATGTNQAISSITQADTTNKAQVAYIEEADPATGDITAQVWGGDLALALDGTDTWEVFFTDAPDLGWAVPLTIGGITLGAAAAIVQTATASNTTETATATVTITPVSSSNLQLVFVWCTTNNGTATIVANTTPTATILNEVVTDVPQSDEHAAAIFAYLPGQTNPSFDVTSGPTTPNAWAIIAIEFDTPSLTNIGVTVNGIVIE